jgi:hypothetical protein
MDFLLWNTPYPIPPHFPTTAYARKQTQCRLPPASQHTHLTLRFTYYLSLVLTFNKNCQTHLHTFGPLLQHSRFDLAHTNQREETISFQTPLRLDQSTRRREEDQIQNKTESNEVDEAVDYLAAPYPGSLQTTTKLIDLLLPQSAPQAHLRLSHTRRTENPKLVPSDTRPSLPRCPPTIPLKVAQKKVLSAVARNIMGINVPVITGPILPTWLPGRRPPNVERTFAKLWISLSRKILLLLERKLRAALSGQTFSLPNNR